MFKYFLGVDEEDDLKSDPFINDLLLNNAETTEYDPPLPHNVAVAFEKLLQRDYKKEDLDRYKSSYKTPENAKLLCAPKVNSEIWQNLPRRPQALDASQQYLQQAVSRALIVQAQIAKILSQNSTKIPSDLTKELLPLVMDGATQMSLAHKEISSKRKMQLKPFLSPDCAWICTANVPVTDKLFGDNLEKDIAAAKTSAKILKSTVPQTNFSSRGRGYGSTFPRNLNFRRPSQINTFQRGGRKNFRASFRGQSFRRNQHNQNQYSQSQ